MKLGDSLLLEHCFDPSCNVNTAYFNNTTTAVSQEDCHC